MSHVVGLIELEPLAMTFAADDADLSDAATLEQLFARLANDALTADGEAAVIDSDTTVITANFASLQSDLQAATRELLAEIFCSRGGRR